MAGVLANEKVIVQYLDQIPSDPDISGCEDYSGDDKHDFQDRTG